MSLQMRTLVTLTALAGCTTPAGSVALDLSGYADESGAIAIQHAGATIDPYFVLQALLLAQEHGLDTTPYAAKWANWLMARQKPDATFDRFCKNGPAWAPCKTADADDSVLALWLKFLETQPASYQRSPAAQKSQQAAKAALAKLVDPSRGVYLVSPVYQHGLFMDNLEVWSYQPAHAAAQNASRPSFARSIHKVFWDEAQQRFLVSTQPEQKATEHAFYPDAVAQIFPLLVKYPTLAGGEKKYYRQWMQQHRADWLKQVNGDFAWGLIAVVAMQQGDRVSAGCWLKTAWPFRHSSHWTVTDEVASQILAAKGVTATPNQESCQ